MKKLFTSLLVLSSLGTFAAPPLKTGTFTGKTNSLFKKDCSIKIEIVEVQSRMYGKIKEYKINTSTKGESVEFGASMSIAELALDYGELGTANGNDTEGKILTAKLDSDGKVLSYKVGEYYTLFGFSKKKTLIDCKNL